jgi:hypothetical protein
MQFDDFQDDGTETQFEPTPWGSRQRVLPRRAFKAAVSVVAAPREEAPMYLEYTPVPAAAPSHVEQAPVIAAQVFAEQAPSYVAEQAPVITMPSWFTPIVRERDIPTWHVPKLPAPAKRWRMPSLSRLLARLNFRRALPIAGLSAVIVIAFFGARSNNSHVSAALGQSHEIKMATIEAPVAAPAPAPIAAVEAAPAIELAPAPAPVIHHTIAKQQFSAHVSTKRAAAGRPKLDVNFATPLGDLAKRHH